jgi:hypothetical protein
MRLINAALVQLERFDDDSKTPPYAILSHTWGIAEVSLQELEDTRKVKTMSGYEKIIKACEQALQDGYAYVWVDTCEVQISSQFHRLTHERLY